MTAPLLSVEGVTKRFGGLVAVNDVSFAVHAGEVVGLMGPNGAGKTTLLNLIAGELDPTAGTIRYRERDITRLAPHRVCHLGVGRTYQTPQPFVSLTLRENLRVSAEFGRRRGKEAAEGEGEKILELVGLADRKDAPAGSLATLSLKRLELARALAAQPDLLLLDEVAAGTSEAEVPRVVETIQAIRRMGITVLIIEHVMRVLVSVVDRLVVLDKGKKIAEGAPDAVMCDERVVAAYFGA
jgi:branched-chain amino acid transport system ATP-binding protein